GEPRDIAAQPVERRALARVDRGYRARVYKRVASIRIDLGETLQNTDPAELATRLDEVLGKDARRGKERRGRDGGGGSPEQTDRRRSGMSAPRSPARPRGRPRPTAPPLRRPPSQRPRRCDRMARMRVGAASAVHS